MSKSIEQGEHERGPASPRFKKRRLEHKDSKVPRSSTSEEKPSTEEYTVGWICVVSTEYVAAQAFLDEKHEAPEHLSPNDSNDYTLGRMGKHNVVIAVLPDGEYGIAAATGVAKDLLNSFPNVRIGLMVGIGGGVPSQKHDIRLGDVVVSAPRDGKGGVFQYDFGKSIQDQSFKVTGFLNQPPTVLRTAVNGLKSSYESEGHRLKEAINNILEKKTRLRKNYSRPNPRSDRLYQTKVTHPLNADIECATGCGDNPSNLVFRPERTEDEDDPVIHYGLIASANQVMKDATIRDRLAEERDVLCFEMEAAGLMNRLPCLVVRGICDYSDSHKNREWQGYAAMVAAAYAKDLLLRIPPNRVQAAKKITEVLSGVQESIQEILRRQQDQEHMTIFSWLNLINYTSQQHDYISRRQPGTGQWFLNSAEYQKWLENDKQTLFCPGIPGAGKTILTSIVVNDLCKRYSNDTSIGIAYLYCNFQQQFDQKPEDLLASLLEQLVQKRPSLPKELRALCQYHRSNQTRPSVSELSNVLQSVAIDYSRIYILVDALDECEGPHQKRNTLISTLFTLQAHSQINIFATSRPDPEINLYFTDCMLKQIRAHDDDVLRYIDARIPELLRSQISEYRHVQETIKEYIMEATDGMFLLAKLHMDSLMSQPTIGHIKQVVRNLPQGIKGLDETYGQAMKRINSQGEGYRELAKQVLSWVAYARRILSTVEVRQALAIRPGMVELDEDFLPEVDLLGSICAGLITVDKSRNIIQLVHHTTQEYLKRTLTNAEKDVAATCLSYLSFDTFRIGLCLSEEEFETRLQQNPLYEYAAQNWGYHVCAASLETEKLTLEFLGDSALVCSCSQAIMDSKHNHFQSFSQGLPKRVTALHLTAYFGLKETTRVLFQMRHDSNAKDTFDRTPLSWAAEVGQDIIVQLLLGQSGVDPDSRDSFGRTPLSWAAENGRECVVKLLLANDKVDPDSKDSSFGQTPLSWAAENGHEAVVKLLLAQNVVDPNTKDIAYHWTPLSLAAVRGHEAVVKLLLAKDNTEPDSDDREGRTPLFLAAIRGHEGVVKLLLASGCVRVDSVDCEGETPLSWAAKKGHSAVEKLLSSGRYSSTE